MSTKIMAGFIRKNWAEIILVLIFLTVVFLRFYRLPETMLWWDGDSAEDMTFAYHMTHFGEKISTARGSVGGGTLLAKSFLIYYLFAGAWLLTNSPIGIGILYALSSVLLVVGIYVVSRYFMGKKYSLILTLMVCFNWYFIYISRVTFHTSLLISLLTVIVWLFLKSWQSRSWKIFVLFILILFSSLHVHYSVLTVFPMLCVWGLINYFRVTKNRKGWIKILIMLLVLLLLGVWVKVTYNEKWLDQFRVLSLVTNSNLGVRDLWQNCQQILIVSFRQLLRIEDIWLIRIFFVIVYGGLGWLTIFDYRKKNLYFRKSLFIISLIICVFGAAWMGGSEAVNRFYVMLYFPWWLLALAYVISRFSEFGLIFKYVGYLIFGIYLILGTNVINYKKGENLLPVNSGGLRESEVVSKKILADSKINLIKDFNIVFYNEYTQQDQFGKAIFWYWIEKTLDKKMIKIEEYHPFSVYLTEINTSKTTYLICSGGTEWKEYKNCEKVFLKNHPDKKYIVEKVGENSSGEWPYMLFKFREF